MIVRQRVIGCCQLGRCRGPGVREVEVLGVVSGRWIRVRACPGCLRRWRGQYREIGSGDG